MPNQKKDFPKIPSSLTAGASRRAVEESDTQPTRRMQPSKVNIKNEKYESRLRVYSSLSLLISVASMGVALLSGAWFAYGILGPEPSDNVFYKVIIVGLTYLIGWVFSAFGIRILRNLLLPFVTEVYTWIAVGGIIILQILIMSKLYRQEYQFSNYFKYLLLFGAGMLALVGLHLILERHSLRPFGVLILLTSLGHLYSIVYHYIFDGTVVYAKLWGDLIFFFVTFSVSLLMLAHFGLLNRMRRLIDRMFDPKTNKFVPRE